MENIKIYDIMPTISMKTYLFIFLFAFLALNVYSLPVSSSSLQLDSEISVDFYTRSEISSSLWHGTTMPGFKIGCSYNYIDPRDQFHQLGLGIKYFESNSFTANSLQLDEGLVRSLLLELNAFYVRYLPMGQKFDYISGLTIDSTYNYYGKVITSEESSISELYYLKLGPINGFSFNIQDRFEIRSLLCLQAGIPLSGRVYFPSGKERDVLPMTIAMKINTEIAYSFNRIHLSLNYNWFNNLLYLIDQENQSPLMDGINTEDIHSIAFHVGIEI